jgi:hypothetical protein
VTGLSDWANFRQFGACFLWAGYQKLQDFPIFRGKFYVLIGKFSEKITILTFKNPNYAKI